MDIGVHTSSPSDHALASDPGAGAEQSPGSRPGTEESKPHSDRKGILRLGIIGAVAASLCCLTPVVLVMGALGVTALFGPEILGVSSGQEVTDKIHHLTDRWYDDYKWAFRAVGLGVIGIGLWVYFRSRGICTANAARRYRNRIINVTVLTLAVSTGFYLAWNYVILHYWGKGVGLPW